MAVSAFPALNPYISIFIHVSLCAADKQRTSVELNWRSDLPTSRTSTSVLSFQSIAAPSVCQSTRLSGAYTVIIIIINVNSYYVETFLTTLDGIRLHPVSSGILLQCCVQRKITHLLFSMNVVKILIKMRSAVNSSLPESVSFTYCSRLNGFLTCFQQHRSKWTILRNYEYSHVLFWISALLRFSYLLLKWNNVVVSPDLLS